jgi:hypothetical protein
MTAHSRIDLPDWPRLMAAPMAAAYVGMSETKLREIGPKPVSADIKRTLYDRKALDRWVDRLSGMPLDDKQVEAETSEVERRLLEKINGYG